METVLAIAVGGGLGSVARHFLNGAASGLTGGSFPWGILIINVLGSFVMGLLVSAFALFGNPPQSIRAFLTVGILGGFTTFSTFSLDAASLIQKGALLPAAGYVAASVGLGIGGLFAGMALVRAFAPLLGNT